MTDLDSQIADAHREAEETEAQARLIEARICKIAGADRMLPQRRYGAPVDAAAIARNLSLRGLIGRKDPQLAAYLGIPYGPSAAEEQARQDREAQVERMRQATIDTALRNHEARRHLERSQLAGLNPLTGRRWN
jgi:hypothetical protein